MSGSELESSGRRHPRRGKQEARKGSLLVLALELLAGTTEFCVSGRPRLALVHHGFRSLQGSGAPRTRSPHFPALGMLSIARSLELDLAEGRLRCDPEFRYFDENVYEDDDALLREIGDWLEPARWRFLLAGVYTLAAERTSKLLSRLDPKRVCLVVGGPHITVAPFVDYAHIAVRGEGAVPMRHILNQIGLASFGEGPEARGIMFMRHGQTVTSTTAFDRSLEQTPAPAFRYELLRGTARPKARWSRAVGASPQIYVCTQSCRARCSFCSTYMIHGKAVSRPAAMVAEDLAILKNDFGHDSIEFHDDDLLQHQEFDELMLVLKRTGLRWMCNARAECLTESIARQMFDAGCRRAFLGLESMDQQILDYYNKKCTVALNRRAVTHLAGAGIGVISGFIIGAPQQTIPAILEDIDRFLELPLFTISPSILTPDIGTVEYHRAKNRGLGLQRLGGAKQSTVVPRPDIFGYMPPYGLPTVCAHATKAELNELHELIYCVFYLRESAWHRIDTYALAERRVEVVAWYQQILRRAENLLASAQLEVVRARAALCVAGSAGAWFPGRA